MDTFLMWCAPWLLLGGPAIFVIGHAVIYWVDRRRQQVWDHTARAFHKQRKALSSAFENGKKEGIAQEFARLEKLRTLEEPAPVKACRRRRAAGRFQRRASSNICIRSNQG